MQYFTLSKWHDNDFAVPTNSVVCYCQMNVGEKSPPSNTSLICLGIATQSFVIIFANAKLFGQQH